MRLPGERGDGVPCLTVDDAQTAADYYRDVLGFEVKALLGGSPETSPQYALVRKHGALLLLQEFADDAPGQSVEPSCGGRPWAGLLFVRDVRAAYDELKARGADLPGSLNSDGSGWQSFEVRDCCGNIICIGDHPDRFLPGGAGYLAGGLRRLRESWNVGSAAREERALLRDFQSFYEKLRDTRDIFYMFFTSGLLHWVVHAERWMPPDINLVLLGSGLTPGEQEWIQHNLERPLHNISRPVDADSAWEFLFSVNRHSFGWLDIDCFVLNSSLLREMAAIDPAVSMNCTWSWNTSAGLPVACTNFLFINASVVHAIKASGLTVSPAAYDWRRSQRDFAGRTCFNRVLTARHRELLLEVLPGDSNGNPQLLPDPSYFQYDTLAVYQLIARALGYPIHQVRGLAQRFRIPVDADNTDSDYWPDEISDELFHLSGISYYRNRDCAPGVRALCMAADYSMLADTADWLPASYGDRREILAGELSRLGVPPEMARNRFRQHLLTARGLSAAAADQVLEHVRVPA
jgi:catechol 2,3-dioxygenase-like lactoylglutathione lyase family enzyme